MKGRAVLFLSLAKEEGGGNVLSVSEEGKDGKPKKSLKKSLPPCKERREKVFSFLREESPPLSLWDRLPPEERRGPIWGRGGRRDSLRKIEKEAVPFEKGKMSGRGKVGNSPEEKGEPLYKIKKEIGRGGSLSSAGEGLGRQANSEGKMGPSFYHKKAGGEEKGLLSSLCQRGGFFLLGRRVEKKRDSYLGKFLGQGDLTHRGKRTFLLLGEEGHEPFPTKGGEKPPLPSY